MEGVFRNVTRTEPCPICGKEDYCTIIDTSNPLCPEEQLHVCRRTTCKNDIISPLNGRTYVFIKELRDCSYLYEESELRAYAQEQWRLANSLTQTNKTKKKSAPVAPVLKKHAQKVHYVPPLPNDQLDAIYRSLLKKLTLYAPHKRYLQNEGWDNSLIQKSLVRSMPAKSATRSSSYFHQISREQITLELIQEFGSVKGVPGFYLDQDNVWTFSGESGILIPQFDTDSLLFRLRLRLSHPPADKNGKIKNKYKYFSSYFEKADEHGQLYNAFHEGSRSGSHLSIYQSPETDDASLWYITEGEKKALLANHLMRYPIISIPGVNCYNKLTEPQSNGIIMLDYLKLRGCKSIVVAYDADKITNPKVLQCERVLIELLKEHGFEVFSANWNIGFGKGLDDILKIGVRPNITRAL